MTTEQELTRTFAALSDPTRRAILTQLAKGPATVGDLAAPHRISGGAITKHLKTLEAAGLIRQERRGQFRPCSLRAEGLAQAKAWIEDRQKFWQTQFDQLEDYLNRTDGC